MKRLICIASLLCAIVTSSYANGLTVYNNTFCTVVFVLYGDVAGSPCGTGYRSNTIFLPPGSAISYADPSAVFGGMNEVGGSGVLGIYDDFSTIRVLIGDPNFCSVTSFAVSPCVGKPSKTYIALDNSCANCASVNVNTFYVGADIQVDFN